MSDDLPSPTTKSICAIALENPLGAGDAFSAGFIDHYLKARGLHAACEFGNVLGALVARQKGATQMIGANDIRQFLQSKPARHCEHSLENHDRR